MTTTVVKTIGTGGDYTVHQTWEDSGPSDLTAVDQIWQGQTLNQEFSSTTTLLTISGTVVDATRYVELTTASGASFIDNASAATNALRYNAANGAAMKTTSYYNPTIVVEQNYTKISKLQVAQTRNGSGSRCALQLGVSSSRTNCDINQCIFESYNVQSSGAFVSGTVTLYGSGNKLRNSAVIQRQSAPPSIAWIGGGAGAYNCAFVSLGGTAGVGIEGRYGTSALENCFVGGCTAVTGGNTTYAKSNCYTDVSGPPSGWNSAPLSTATFINISNGTHDLRLVNGSTLIGAGVVDTTNAANDILGVSRGSSTNDVGCHKYIASGATAPGATLTGTGSLSAGTASGGGAATAPGATLTGTGSLSAGSAAGGSAGTITTHALKNNTGLVYASISGWTLTVYDATTGDKVARLTGLITDSGGVLTMTHASLVPGTSYLYEAWHGTYGRRLPLKAAA